MVWEKKLTRLPDHYYYKGWIHRGNEEVCMYPSSLHGPSNWKVENCPCGGLISMVLAREEEVHKVHSKKAIGSPSECNTQSKKETKKK